MCFLCHRLLLPNPRDAVMQLSRNFCNVLGFSDFEMKKESPYGTAPGDDSLRCQLLVNHRECVEQQFRKAVFPPVRYVDFHITLHQTVKVK